MVVHTDWQAGGLSVPIIAGKCEVHPKPSKLQR